MITVVIPTLNGAQGLNQTFAALVPASVDGLISAVIVVDGGSNDKTLELADAAGARIIHTAKGRGVQLAQGGEAVKTKWILFLHADTVLTSGWEVEVRDFMARAALPGALRQAAVFKFSVDEPGTMARVMEAIVALRCWVFALPYGDQGLLISTDFYRRIGGYNPLPLMEDVDIIRRIGTRHLAFLRTRARTSFARYRKDGILRRIFRNLTCLTLYFLGVSPARIARRYE